MCVPGCVNMEIYESYGLNSKGYGNAEESVVSEDYGLQRRWVLSVSNLSCNRQKIQLKLT